MPKVKLTNVTASMCLNIFILSRMKVSSNEIQPNPSVRNEIYVDKEIDLPTEASAEKGTTIHQRPTTVLTQHRKTQCDGKAIS